MSSSVEKIEIREDRYTEILARQAQSPTLRQVYRDVYRDEYPDEADPFGFLSMTELRHVTAELRLTPGQRMADVGCGRGGPGLWAARELGAHLVGSDIVAAAVEQARERIDDFGLAGRAEFHTASAVDTGLATGGLDAVMSIDALWMVVDKRAAFLELARVLRPGGRLVFTTWQPAHLEYSWLLEPAGFVDVEIVQFPGWLERQSALYGEVVRRREELAAELGEDGLEVFLAEARTTPAMLSGTPRIVVSATRAGQRPG